MIGIPAPTDPAVRFVLKAIADELRYCDTLPGDRPIGYTEAAWMLEEYIAGKLSRGDFDSPDVFKQLEDWQPS